MLSGVGVLGGWALEFLARSPIVDRIVTVERRPWAGPSRPALAMLGAVFQGHAKRFEHYQADLSETEQMAGLLSSVKPDVILHSATLQSPRQLMNANLDPAVRDLLRTATFGMWLPWHLLPATWLFEAIEASGIDDFCGVDVALDEKVVREALVSAGPNQGRLGNYDDHP